MVDNSENQFLKDIIKKNWKILTIFIIIGIGCAIDFVIVLLLQINNSWVGGYGDWSIGEFSVGTALLFLIQLILWELLLVFLPGMILFAILGYYWWRKLSPEDKKTIKEREKREREFKYKQYGGGGGFTFFIWIFFFIIVFVDGKWLVTFDALKYTYFVYAWLLGLMLVLIIIIVPAVILGLIWFLRKK